MYSLLISGVWGKVDGSFFSGDITLFYEAAINSRGSEPTLPLSALGTGRDFMMNQKLPRFVLKKFNLRVLRAAGISVAACFSQGPQRNWYRI